MSDKYDVVVDKVCEIYGDDGETMALTLDELALEHTRCGSRDGSAHWRMLYRLINHPQVLRKS